MPCPATDLDPNKTLSDPEVFLNKQFPSNTTGGDVTHGAVFSVVISNSAGSVTSGVATLVASLQLVSLTAPPATNWVLGWTSMTGKLYAVEQSTDLVSGAWVASASNVAGALPTCTATVQRAAGDHGFCRIREE